MVVSLPYGSGRLFWARAHAGSVTTINSELAAVSAAISAVSTWKRPATPLWRPSPLAALLVTITVANAGFK